MRKVHLTIYAKLRRPRQLWQQIDLQATDLLSFDCGKKVPEIDTEQYKVLVYQSIILN